MAKLKKENLKTEWCKSCQYCVASCPKGALSIGNELNLAGFQYVVLDETKCINCGTCRTVCPDCVFKFVED